MSQDGTHLAVAAFTDSFKLYAAKSGLQILERQTSAAEWAQALQLAPYVPVAYTSAMLDYQHAYFAGQGGAWQDCSMILLNDSKPCAVWPLSLSKDGNAVRLSSAGAAVLPPLFLNHVAPKTIKSVTTRCHALLAALAVEFSLPGYTGQEPFLASTGLSEWYLQAVRHGARGTVGHEMYADLSPALDQIRASFRKSFKPLISVAERTWQVGICTAESPALWDEFRLLHLKVAGRSTRSLESWQVQHQAIASGSAFFVYLRDEAGRMIGGGLFHVSRDEGLYAVGAYDRALFDKPLGHLVQYHAIREMKRRGLRWYKLGNCAYPGDTPPPTEKEISISHFKQGFASHHFAHLRFELDLAAENAPEGPHTIQMTTNLDSRALQAEP